MTAQKIKAFAFDLGKVLIEFDFNKMFTNLSKITLKSHEELQDYFNKSEVVKKFECGQLTMTEATHELNQWAGTRLQEHEFQAIFTDIFSPLPEMSDIVLKLQEHYPVAIISNTCAPHTAQIRKQFPFFDRVEKKILSFEQKVMKPNREIYEAALKVLNCKAEECFFTDDVQVNIDAAKKLGMEAVLFTGKDSILKYLPVS